MELTYINQSNTVIVAINRTIKVRYGGTLPLGVSVSSFWEIIPDFRRIYGVVAWSSDRCFAPNLTDCLGFR